MVARGSWGGSATTLSIEPGFAGREPSIAGLPHSVGPKIGRGIFKDRGVAGRSFLEGYAVAGARRRRPSAMKSPRREMPMSGRDDRTAGREVEPQAYLWAKRRAGREDTPRYHAFDAHGDVRSSACTRPWAILAQDIEGPWAQAAPPCRPSTGSAGGRWGLNPVFHDHGSSRSSCTIPAVSAASWPTSQAGLIRSDLRVHGPPGLPAPWLRLAVSAGVRQAIRLRSATR